MEGLELDVIHGEDASYHLVRFWVDCDDWEPIGGEFVDVNIPKLGFDVWAATLCFESAEGSGERVVLAKLFNAHLKNLFFVFIVEDHKIEFSKRR